VQDGARESSAGAISGLKAARPLRGRRSP
jgi:hypothetical protein